MTADMTGANVPMIADGDSADAQQRWPALHAETHAQLMVKRAQQRHLGRGRATRAADGMQTADVDSKTLRWIAEIVSDGSQIPCLSGRSARLADGPSSNPGNRDGPLEEITQGLVNGAGKDQNFNLRQYLSEYEEPGSVTPRATEGDGYINLHEADAAQGIVLLDSEFGTRSLSA